MSLSAGVRNQIVRIVMYLPFVIRNLGRFVFVCVCVVVVVWSGDGIGVHILNSSDKVIMLYIKS